MHEELLSVVQYARPFRAAWKKAIGIAEDASCSSTEKESASPVVLRIFRP
jgi:hypothetical protein